MLTFCKCRALTGTLKHTLKATASRVMRSIGFDVKQILLAMRITAAILLICTLHVTAKGVSQTITLSGKDIPLKTLFNEIRKQSGYVVFYNNEIIENAKPVTINVEEQPLAEFLDNTLHKQGLDYEIQNKTIVVKHNEKDIQDSPKYDPPIDVKGRVVDENGQPVEGATVQVKGRKQMTVTNSNGEFELKGVYHNAVLEITATNIETKQVAVGGRSDLATLPVKIKVTSLHEVVINKGYYTEKKRFSIGNVSTIKAADIEKQPIQNPLLALQGRVPGIEITQLTGMPGGATKVRIQGQNSIMSGLEPLVVVDGVPYPTQLLGTSGEDIIIRGGSPLNYINPSDIESIDVLKDADATAIYGSRAANGAILITTKKGKIGRTKLSINLQQGWGKVTRKVDMMNTRQYLDMRYEALRNDGIGTIPNSANDLKLWDTTRYTDWQKELIGGTAHYTDIGAGVSGGTAAMQYLIGSTYRRQTDVFPGEFDDKGAGLHFNVNGASSNQKLKLTLTGSYFFDKNRLPGVDRTEQALLMEPNAPSLYNADGTLNWAPNAAGNSTWINPLASIKHAELIITSKNLIASFNLAYSILKGLDFRGNVGYMNLQSDLYNAARLESYRPERRPTSERFASFTNLYENSWIVEPTLNYSALLGKGKLEAIVGATMQDRRDGALVLWGTGYTSDLMMKSIYTAPTQSVESAGTTIYKYSAFFGRLNYIWDDKYIVNLTGRRDASSRFGDENKEHDFGSIGAGWIFSEEKSIKQQLPFLSFGKLRASYGTTGNDQIDDYSYLSLYGPVSAPVSYQNTSSLGVTKKPSNPHLQWEETRKLQFGIDLGFMNDRVVLGVTHARNRSSNLLTVYVLPSITGFTSVIDNYPATVQNSSWEFTLNTTNVKLGDFSWTSSINFTLPQNKLISFPDIESTPYGGPNSTTIIGQPVGLFRTLRYAGVDPATGKYLVLDVNGKPTSSPDLLTDMTQLKSSFSKYYGGFGSTFSYKGVELDVLFQFVWQMGERELYYRSPNSSPGRFSFAQSNQPVTVLNRWQKPGDNAELSRFSTSEFGVPGYVLDSDAFYSYDASYIRLKNLSLSWQIPEKVLQKMRLQNARLFFRGQNLATISNYTGLDPETRSIQTLPPLQMWTVGGQLTL